MIRKIVSRLSGLTTAATWSDDAFKTDTGRYDRFNERMLRYYLSERYYNNDQYMALNVFHQTLKRRMNLYKHIRGIYNPVERLVEGSVATLYGGRLELDDLSAGAIPIVTENTTEREAITGLFRQSRMKQEKNTYGRNGAKFGDSFWKVVDDESEGVTWLEALDPRKVCYMEKDSRQRITYILIGWIEQRGDDSVVYITEEITPDTVRIYEDEARPDYEHFAGGRVADEYPNPYGFVPVTHGLFRYNGNLYGVNAFWAQRGKIDEMNDVASVLHDNMRNALEQIYHAKGVSKGNLQTNRDEPTRDMIRIIYTASNTELVPLLKSIDVSGATTTLDRMADELAADLPVLSLHTLRDMSEISAPAIRAAYSDAVSRIEETQSNLDVAFERAIAMALAIEGFRGRLPGFNLNYYTDNAWEFHIGNREIIHSEMSDFEVVQALATITPDSPTAELALKRMDFSQDEIDKVIADAQSTRQSALRQSVLSAQAGNLTNLQRAGAAIRNNRAAPPEETDEEVPDDIE